MLKSRCNLDNDVHTYHVKTSVHVLETLAYKLRPGKKNPQIFKYLILLLEPLNPAIRY